MKKPVNIVDKAMEIARSVRRVPKKSAKKKAKKPALVVMDVEQEIPIANALRLARGGGGGADSGQAANRPSSGGGPGGGMMGGSGSGGPSRTAPSTATGGDKGGKGGIGTGGAGVGGDKGGKGGVGAGGGGGPSRGPTDQPSRTEPSKATKPPEAKTSVSPAAREPTGYSRPAGYGTAPSGVYGPRMGSDIVSTAPSTFSTENAMKKIAEGSSIVGGYPESKIQDRVPAPVAAPVKLEQAPTISRNAYDAYTPADADIFAGANSPLAGGGLDSYNRDTYQSLQTPTQQAALNAANQAAADARFVSSDVSAPVPSSGNVSTLTRSAIPAGAPVSPTYVAGDPRVNYAPSAYSAPAQAPQTIGSKIAYTEQPGPFGANPPTWSPTSQYPIQPASSVPDRQISSIVSGDLPLVATGSLPPGYAQTGRVITGVGAGWPVQNIAANVTPVSTSPYPPSQSTPKQFGERLVSYNGGTYEVSPQQMAQMTPEDQARMAAYNQQVSYTPPVVSDPRVNFAPGSYPAAYDTQTTSADNYVYDTNYGPAVSPSQQEGGYFTPEQRSSYLGGLGDTRSSERPLLQERKKKPAVIAQAPVPPTKPSVSPPYVYRDYLSENYGTPLPPPSTSIADFNAYNQRYMNRGGRIGGSAEAALRIAKSKLL